VKFHQCRDFLVAISASDLVRWSGEDDERCIGNPYLIAALNAIDISLDPKNLYFLYFDKISIGSGDVYWYESPGTPANIFAIDLYRGVYDQHDVIQFVIRAHRNAAVTKIALRSFIDVAEAQFCYEESNSSQRVEAILNFGAYPKKIEESGYFQKVQKVERC